MKDTSYSKLEINMHHLRRNAIPAGHVQNPLSDSYRKFCFVEGFLGPFS